MTKEEEKLNELGSKFIDITALRDKIIGESTEIANILKKNLAQRKAMSPEMLTKNIKSISSFLENFNRMIVGLSTKLGSLGAQLNKTKEMADQIISSAKIIK